VADEDTVLEEAMDNLKEAGQRIRATQSLMRSEGMTDGEDYRDLLTRLSTALAMTEAAYLEPGVGEISNSVPTHCEGG
jgi:predicted RNase H-like HicB family nuclease